MNWLMAWGVAPGRCRRALTMSSGRPALPAAGGCSFTLPLASSGAMASCAQHGAGLGVAMPWQREKGGGCVAGGCQQQAGSMAVGCSRRAVCSVACMQRGPLRPASPRARRQSRGARLPAAPAAWPPFLRSPSPPSSTAPAAAAPEPQPWVPWEARWCRQRPQSCLLKPGKRAAPHRQPRPAGRWGQCPVRCAAALSCAACLLVNPPSLLVSLQDS